jgi:hypothetical protein
MRIVLQGFRGWIHPQPNQSQSSKVVDTALVAVLAGWIVTTWFLIA